MTVTRDLMGVTEGDQESLLRSPLPPTLELKSQIAVVTSPYEVLTANQNQTSTTVAIAEAQCKTPDLGLPFFFAI